MLIEHYLMEDIPEVIEQQDTILNACLNAMNDTKEGRFINEKQFLGEIHGAFQILSALNDKKIHRDQNHSIYTRRGWTQNAELIRRNYF